MIKKWISKLRLKNKWRYFFGIKEFNKNEITELISYYDNGDFNTYTFKIFQKIKKLSGDKHKLINTDFYYNNLATIMANELSKNKSTNPKTRLEYTNMILENYIFAKVIMDETSLYLENNGYYI